MARSINCSQPERLSRRRGRHLIFMRYPWWYRAWMAVLYTLHVGGRRGYPSRGEWRYIG